jgi:hypothetical protein
MHVEIWWTGLGGCDVARGREAIPTGAEQLILMDLGENVDGWMPF